MFCSKYCTRNQGGRMKAIANHLLTLFLATLIMCTVVNNNLYAQVTPESMREINDKRKLESCSRKVMGVAKYIDQCMTILNEVEVLNNQEMQDLRDARSSQPKEAIESTVKIQDSYKEKRKEFVLKMNDVVSAAKKEFTTNLQKSVNDEMKKDFNKSRKSGVNN